MSDNHEQILSHILEIIGYEGDRTLFVRDFFEACKAKAMSTEAFQTALETSTAGLFEDYLMTIIPALTTEEKSELTAYLAKQTE